MTTCTTLTFIPTTGKTVQLGTGYDGFTIDASSRTTHVTTDDTRFRTEFSDGASSWLPVQIFTISGGKVVNATMSYPAAVRGDASRAWRQFVKNDPKSYGLGDLAGWAADECTLGRQTQAFARIKQLDAAGKLTGDSSYWPTGTAFVSKLRQLLKKDGYLK
jgi:hypothetical protein